MTLRSNRSSRMARALVLLPTALCVSGVVMAVQHGDGTAALRTVADPAPSPTSTPSAAVTLTPQAAMAPATVVGGASVTRVRPGHAVPVGSGAVAPLAGRRAVTTAADTRPSAAVAGIGTIALAAYQRAAVVVDDANPACRLDWTLLAAIGAVESGHGTYGGSTLDAAGLASPAIMGPVLDGRHHTRLISDTDGGRLDHDTRYDRALGPMQILPATWLQIAIDADGDGRRDPQDINDAALAAAVYLCSAGGDLSTPAGARPAVLRYNRSTAYADTVLDLAAGYQQDAAATTSVAGLVTSGGVVSAVDAQPVAPAGPTGHQPAQHGTKVHHPAAGHGLRHHAVPQPAVPPALTSTATPPPPQPARPPQPPVVAPAPPSATPAPAAAQEDACREAVVTTYPTAGADVVAAAVSACVEGLAGLSDDEARSAMPDLVADLAASVPGLAPAVASPTVDASTSPAEPVSP